MQECEKCGCEVASQFVIICDACFDEDIDLYDGMSDDEERAWERSQMGIQ